MQTTHSTTTIAKFSWARRRLPNIRFVLDPANVIRFLYPHGFTQIGCTIVPSLPVPIISAMSGMHVFSHSIHDSIDGPNGHIDSMLSNYVLSRLSSPQAPPHELLLKVGDICLVTRTLNSKRDQMSTNAWFRFFDFTKNAFKSGHWTPRPGWFLFPGLDLNSDSLTVTPSASYEPSSQAGVLHDIQQISRARVWKICFGFHSTSLLIIPWISLRWQHSADLAFFMKSKNVHDDAVGF